MNCFPIKHNIILDIHQHILINYWYFHKEIFHSSIFRININSMDKNRKILFNFNNKLVQMYNINYFRIHFNNLNY